MSAQTAPKVPHLNLRFAEETDVEIILGLIRGLADYERLSHEVTADAKTLRRSLFGARPVAEVVIAEVDGTPVGFALFFPNFSTFRGLPGIYIEDLYILKSFQEAAFHSARTPTSLSTPCRRSGVS
jgi:hypothetical protein